MIYKLFLILNIIIQLFLRVINLMNILKLTNRQVHINNFIIFIQIRQIQSGM